MKIAPIDIVHKTFGRKFGGLDPEEVFTFLKQIADDLEAVIHERNQLKEVVREKELQMLEYRERDKSIKETLMTAHKMTEQIRRDAEREAAIVLNDANQKADAIISNARDSLKKTYQEISELKKIRTQFEVELKNLVTSHLELMERHAGYTPHVPSPDEAHLGGNTPNLRAGRPIQN